MTDLSEGGQQDSLVVSGDFASQISESVTERLVSCVRFVKAATGMDLDFSHETLPILDHYLASARADMGTRPEAGPLIAEAAGAYFGQVLAREFAAFWHASDPDVHTWALCFQQVFLALNPIGVGYDVLFEGQAPSGPSGELKLAKEDQESVRRRLESLPEVREQDYFSFSERYDAIETAVEELRSQMLSGGVEDVTFEWADYEPEFGR